MSKNNKAQDYAGWRFMPVAEEYEYGLVESSFKAGWDACASIKDAELAELKEQLRWRSFTKDKLPTIGMTIISKRKNNDEYDITFLKNHDVIHYLCETSIEWLPIPRKEEE